MLTILSHSNFPSLPALLMLCLCRSKAVLWLGQLRLSCSEEQLLALVGLLTHSLAFGPISSWGTDVFIEIGVLAGIVHSLTNVQYFLLFTVLGKYYFHFEANCIKYSFITLHGKKCQFLIVSFGHLV